MVELTHGWHSKHFTYACHIYTTVTNMPFTKVQPWVLLTSLQNWMLMVLQQCWNSIVMTYNDEQTQKNDEKKITVHQSVALSFVNVNNQRYLKSIQNAWKICTVFGTAFETYFVVRNKWFIDVVKTCFMEIPNSSWHW